MPQIDHLRRDQCHGHGHGPGLGPDEEPDQGQRHKGENGTRSEHVIEPMDYEGARTRPRPGTYPVPPLSDGNLWSEVPKP